MTSNLGDIILRKMVNKILAVEFACSFGKKNRGTREMERILDVQYSRPCLQLVGF